MAQNLTTEMQRTLELIKVIMTSLYKLPIRRPAPLDRLRNETLIEASYQHFDVLYVKDKFPLLDPKVATRLGKMISRRRQLLLYREAHNEHLDAAKVEPKITLPAQLVQDSGGLEAGSDMTSRREPTQSQSGSTRFELHSKATTLRINTANPESTAFLHAPSIAESEPSVASSYAGRDLRVQVPQRPKGVSGETLDCFECPYCLTTQEIRSDYAWK